MTVSMDDIVADFGGALQRVDSSSIKAAAVKNGFQTLRVDGALKVLEGVTSVEEVLLATHEEAQYG